MTRAAARKSIRTFCQQLSTLPHIRVYTTRIESSGSGVDGTHEPLSSSLRRRATAGLSVVTLISVAARMLVSPVRVNSLPLRLRTTGG